VISKTGSPEDQTVRIRPIEILRRHVHHPQTLQILLDHSRHVTKRAITIAQNSPTDDPVDLNFIAEAAMLHDIGIIATNTPDLGCRGTLPYLCHGVEGRKILEKEGLPRHARVCETHIGVGLTAAEIAQDHLPLPERDMIPETPEEQIICYADLFYSKGSGHQTREKDCSAVEQSLRRFGEDKVALFRQWQARFEPEQSP